MSYSTHSSALAKILDHTIYQLVTLFQRELPIPFAAPYISFQQFPIATASAQSLPRKYFSLFARLQSVPGPLKSIQVTPSKFAGQLPL